MDKQKKQSKTVKPVHKADGGGLRTGNLAVGKPMMGVSSPGRPAFFSRVDPRRNFSMGAQSTNSMFSPKEEMMRNNALQEKLAAKLAKNSTGMAQPTPAQFLPASVGKKGYKKGGSAKTSTRGAGSESRGKKTRFV